LEQLAILIRHDRANESAAHHFHSTAHAGARLQRLFARMKG
jgi:hypothetical protein